MITKMDIKSKLDMLSLGITKKIIIIIFWKDVSRFFESYWDQLKMLLHVKFMKFFNKSSLKPQ